MRDDQRQNALIGIRELVLGNEDEECRFACGTYFRPLADLEPRLSIDGLGASPIKLPVEGTQLKELEKLCEPAKFGRGTATHTDTTVRNSLQLSGEKVHIMNTEWNTALQQLIDEEVKKSLGIEKAQTVHAQLYKLLLHREGGHFDFHKDTEKFDGMFGTLSVQLPSKFTGGVYVVRQNGQQQRFRMEAWGIGAADTRYVAHFADCEHSVEEVTSGHRLVLVYALCTPPGGAPEVTDEQKAAELATKIETWLEAWHGDEEDAADSESSSDEAEGRPAKRRKHVTSSPPRQVALALRQEYTPHALRRQGRGALKGADKARVELLVAALERVKLKPRGLKLWIVQAKKQMKMNPADGMDVWGDDGGDWSEAEEEADGSGADDDAPRRPRRPDSLQDWCLYDMNWVEDVAVTAVACEGGRVPPKGKQWTLDADCSLIDCAELFDREPTRAQVERIWGAATGDSGVMPTGNEGAERDLWYERFLFVAELQQ